MYSFLKAFLVLMNIFYYENYKSYLTMKEW